MSIDVRWSRLRSRAWSGIAAIAFAWGALGCSPTDPTEIVAGVSTQIRVPEDLVEVGMVVQVNGRMAFCQTYPVADGTVTLPATLGVLGKAGEAARGATVTVQVVGLRQLDTAFSRDCTLRAEDSAGVTVIRRRRLTFVDNQIKFLPLPLKESCADIEQSCDENETCVGGKCVPIDVDARDLPDYDDSLIFGDTNTCFDGNRCMASDATVPVLLDDPETCTFTALWPDDAPAPERGNLNVRLFYRSFGTEILDLDFDDVRADQREGFEILDERRPLRFRLAPNLCETNYQRERVLAIDASALCAAKRAYQPICNDYEPPNPRGDDSPRPRPGDSDPGICTIGGLEPVESAIYVLMDRSLSMSKFFGDGGLRYAVELPLSSPVARRTKVAFALLPPEADQCGTPAYAENPEVPFGGVEVVREPISELLQGGGVVLDADPPQFFLEAALQGAYQAVRAIAPEDAATGFNRRAVVVLSNRDILAGGCPGEGALTMAERALASADRVFTYAVALDEGEEGAVESAEALATAGGTRAFDGVADEAEGARAVNDILTELGTCLYRVKRSDGRDDEPLPTSAFISYIDPSSPARSGVDIPYEPTCDEQAGSDVSGWNQDSSGLVRLCGRHCQDLRDAIGDFGALHATQGRVAPAVPLVVTAPCSR